MYCFSDKNPEIRFLDIEKPLIGRKQIVSFTSVRLDTVATARFINLVECLVHRKETPVIDKMACIVPRKSESCTRLMGLCLYYMIVVLTFICIKCVNFAK